MQTKKTTILCVTLLVLVCSSVQAGIFDRFLTRPTLPTGLRVLNKSTEPRSVTLARMVAGRFVAKQFTVPANTVIQTPEQYTHFSFLGGIASRIPWREVVTTQNLLKIK